MKLKLWKCWWLHAILGQHLKSWKFSYCSFLNCSRYFSTQFKWVNLLTFRVNLKPYILMWQAHGLWGGSSSFSWKFYYQGTWANISIVFLHLVVSFKFWVLNAVFFYIVRNAAGSWRGAFILSFFGCTNV